MPRGHPIGAPPLPRKPVVGKELLEHETEQIMICVGETVSLVESLLVECSDCLSLYDARVELAEALYKLHSLMPKSGNQWIYLNLDNGKMQWYEVKDKSHRGFINGWMCFAASKHGVCLKPHSIERYYNLLGEDWYKRPRPPRAAATVKATAEVRAPPGLALPGPSEFECVGGHAATADAQTAPFTTPQISTSKLSGAPASALPTAAPASTFPSDYLPAAPASAPPHAATPLAETAVAKAPPEPKPTQPPPPVRAISAAAGPAVPQASVYLLQHVFPIESTMQ